MPTLFIIFGLKFFFYSNDHDPIHVHVSKEGKEAKFQVEPLELIENCGLKLQDLKIAEAAILENKDVIVERQKEYLTNKEKTYESKGNKV